MNLTAVSNAPLILACVCGLHLAGGESDKNNNPLGDPIREFKTTVPQDVAAALEILVKSADTKYKLSFAFGRAKDGKQDVTIKGDTFAITTFQSFARLHDGTHDTFEDNKNALLKFEADLNKEQRPQRGPAKSL